MLASEPLMLPHPSQQAACAHPIPHLDLRPGSNQPQQLNLSLAASPDVPSSSVIAPQWLRTIRIPSLVARQGLTGSWGRRTLASLSCSESSSTASFSAASESSSLPGQQQRETQAKDLSAAACTAVTAQNCGGSGCRLQSSTYVFNQP